MQEQSPDRPVDRLIDLVLVDDHPCVGSRLAAVLSAAGGGRIRVVGCTHDVSAAAHLVVHEQADLVLVDLALPAPGGLCAIAAVRDAAPAVRVVAMSGTADEDEQVEALRAGAEAVLLTSGDPETWVPLLLALVQGWAVLPAPLLRRLLADARPPGSDDVVGRLSADDRRLWRLVTAGTSTVGIALALHVSERTAKRLVAGLLRELRVSSRTEAAALAGRVGLAISPARTADGGLRS